MMKRTTEPNSTKISAKGEHKIIYFMPSAISSSSIFLAGCECHVETHSILVRAPTNGNGAHRTYWTFLQQQPVKSEKWDRGRRCEQFYGALLTVEGIQIVCHFAFDKNMWGQACESKQQNGLHRFCCVAVPAVVPRRRLFIAALEVAVPGVDVVARLADTMFSGLQDAHINEVILQSHPA